MEEIYQQAPAEWKEVLELICSLIDEKGGINGIIPNVDHGRIEYFVKQILEYERPEWMTNVVAILGRSLNMPEVDQIAGNKDPKDRK